MTRQKRIERARQLRAEGWNNVEIAKRFGVTESCVWKWLNPESAKEKMRRDNAKRHEAKLAWQREKDASPEGRGYCERCGGLMGYGSARVHARVCRACLVKQGDATLRRLEELWNEGRTYPEIRAELGWSEGMVSMMVHRARSRGYNLPYRYTKAGYRFPEQVAA